jgi:hypothetical protein
MTSPAASTPRCLERTRSAVLNVLVAAGIGIAASGFLLRWRDRWATTRAPEGARRAMMLGLFGLALASFLRRRLGGVFPAPADPAQRETRFFRRHVSSAILAALAVPLGLAYGWWIRPRLDAVAPFWIVALALGFLALPRAGLEGATDDPAATA